MFPLKPNFSENFSSSFSELWSSACPLVPKPGFTGPGTCQLPMAKPEIKFNKEKNKPNPTLVVIFRCLVFFFPRKIPTKPKNK